jgi:hypothetical protein
MDKLMRVGAPGTGQIKRVPMRCCRGQKPAKSAASIVPVAAGCHPARPSPDNTPARRFVPSQRQPGLSSPNVPSAFFSFDGIKSKAVGF